MATDVNQNLPTKQTQTDSENSDQRYIICMKWGDKYGAEYVNRLYNMVRRNLTLDFQMVCLTDDSTGIDPAVICHLSVAGKSSRLLNQNYMISKAWRYF